jgi:hypothetical protein
MRLAFAYPNGVVLHRVLYRNIRCSGAHGLASGCCGLEAQNRLRDAVLILCGSILDLGFGLLQLRLA